MEFEYKGEYEPVEITDYSKGQEAYLQLAQKVYQKDYNLIISICIYAIKEADNPFEVRDIAIRKCKTLPTYYLTQLHGAEGLMDSLIGEVLEYLDVMMADLDYEGFCREYLMKECKEALKDIKRIEDHLYSMTGYIKSSKKNINRVLKYISEYPQDNKD